MFTNVLTVPQYGLYQYFVYITTFLSGLAILGIPAGTFRYMVKYDVAKDVVRYRNTIMTGIFLIFLIQTLLVGIVIILTFFNITFFSSYNSTLIILASVFLYFALIKTAIGDVIRAKQYALSYFVFSGLQPVFTLVLGLFFIIGFNNKDLGLIYGYVFMQFIYTFIFMFQFADIFLNGRFSSKEASDIIKYGAPGIPSSFMVIVYTFFLQWLLQVYYGYPGVAIYNIGTTISNIVGLLTIIISAVFGTIVFRYFEHQLHDKLSNFLNRTLRVFLLVFVSTSFLIYGLSSRIIVILSNTNYLASREIVLPLLIVLMIQIFRTYTTQGIWLKNKTKSASMTFIIGGIFAIFIGLFLIPIYGVIGAALTQVIYELSIIIMQFPLSQHYYDNNFDKKRLLFLILFISTGYLGLYFLEDLLRSAFVASIIITALFIIVCLLFSIITKEDLIYTYNLILELIPRSIKNKIVSIL